MAMNLRANAGRIAIPLTTGAASLTVLAVTAASASASGHFNGGMLRVHHGARDREAIDDDENSASGEGQFNCG